MVDGTPSTGRIDVDLTVEPAQPDKSIGQLVSEMTTDLSTLMRQEVELAREELKVEVNKAGKAGKGLGAAAVVGLLTGMSLVLTLGFALDTFLWRWLAFLIVTAVLGAIAAALAMAGKKQIDDMNLTPEKTIQTLEEDKQWLSEQKS